MRAKYGLSLQQIDAMWEAQGRKCAICRRSIKTYGRVIAEKAYVDHNHETGEIRGLLCHHCNTMLGMAKDNPELLMAGAAYLEQHS